MAWLQDVHLYCEACPPQRVIIQVRLLVAPFIYCDRLTRIPKVPRPESCHYAEQMQTLTRRFMGHSSFVHRCGTPQCRLATISFLSFGEYKAPQLASSQNMRKQGRRVTWIDARRSWFPVVSPQHKLLLSCSGLRTAGHSRYSDPGGTLLHAVLSSPQYICEEIPGCWQGPRVLSTPVDVSGHYFSIIARSRLKNRLSDSAVR